MLPPTIAAWAGNAVFALVAYFGFARTLGINIGAGWIENAIESVLGIGGNT